MIKHICLYCKNVQYIPDGWLTSTHKLLCYVCQNVIQDKPTKKGDKKNG